MKGMGCVNKCLKTLNSRFKIFRMFRNKDAPNCMNEKQGTLHPNINSTVYASPIPGQDPVSSHFTSMNETPRNGDGNGGWEMGLAGRLDDVCSALMHFDA